jgi:hypothetical protein
MKIRYQADNDLDQRIIFFWEAGTPEDFNNTVRIISQPF